MTRLLPLLLIALLVTAACGGSGSEGAPTPGESGRSQSEASGTSTPPKSSTPTPSTTPPEAPTETTGERESGQTETGSGDETREPPAEGTPIDAPDLSPTPVPDDPVPTPPPSPTPPAIDPIPAIYPTFPPIPEITSCEQAADLSIEAIQIWLDALVHVPFDTVFDDGVMPPDFEAFSALMDDHMSEIDALASSIGCGVEELELLLFARLDQLVANNETAEMVLELLQDFAANPPPTPEATVGPTPDPVDLHFETCEQAADLFIELIQTLVFDVVADWTMEELDSGQEPPEPIQLFIDEADRLRDQFLSIGCGEVEVTSLISERLDQLVVTGEAGQEVFAALKNSIAEGNLFAELDE